MLPALPRMHPAAGHGGPDTTVPHQIVKLGQGECYLTAQDNEELVTVLGSCIAACIRDPVLRLGGMNHFLLPDCGRWETGDGAGSLRYGSYAMDRLIGDILARGGLRPRLEVKVFGGANVMCGGSNIGHRNADFVERYLAAEGMTIAAAHLRGIYARRVHYVPTTGKVMLLELHPTEETALPGHGPGHPCKPGSPPGPIELS